MANTPPPVNCSRCGEPYSSFSHQCWAEKEKSEARRSAAACHLPPYDEWRKLPPDEAARILAKKRGLDAEQEGLIAAILERFREENI